MKLTPKRLAANRRNALHSTGPRSDKGKQKVSRNATKHGLFVKSLLVEGESPESLNALVNAFYNEFDPQTPSECLYVDKIIAAQWRSTRLWATQSANLSDEVRRQHTSVAAHDPATRIAYAMRSLLDKGRSQDALSLYEHRFDRQQQHALEALERLKQRRHSGHLSPIPLPEISPGKNKPIMDVENKSETVPDPAIANPSEGLSNPLQSHSPDFGSEPQ